MTFFLLLGLACSGAKHPTTALQLGEARVRAELVFDLTGRSEGLKHRDRLGTDDGMLFIYPDIAQRSFWMKDTRIPLSIAFADANGVILRIADMDPFDVNSTNSLYPAKYALEVNQGWFEANGVDKGTVIEGIPTDLDVR